MTTSDESKAIPQALKTKYEMSAVNDPITLFEGAATIHVAAGPSMKDVVVKHEWIPRPNVICQYSEPGRGEAFGSNAAVTREPVRIEIPSIGLDASFRFQRGRSSGGQQHWEFALQSQVELGSSDDLTRLVFHAVNCRDFSDTPIKHGEMMIGNGRIELDSGEWRITIDQTETGHDLEQSLDLTGGRAITHRVGIERANGGRFCKEDVEETASLIEHFIAFVTGSWVQLVLPIGFQDESESYSVWRARSGRPWTNPYTWSKYLPGKIVKKVFKGFSNRFSDEDWAEPLKQTVDWYVQCRNGTTETSIILGQAALELLSWVIFVENGGVILGSAGFENLWASDRIRLLLSHMQVAANFPPMVTQLGEFKFDGHNTYADGPHAITEIRNGITHPKKKKRERFGPLGPGLRGQASELGLFYLEACLLGLCGYFGPFRADSVCGALYSRDPNSEPVYQSADFNEFLPGFDSYEDAVTNNEDGETDKSEGK